MTLAACAGAPPAPEAPQVAAAPGAEPVATEPPQPPIGGPVVHPCEHARRCCHAYIDTMVGVIGRSAADIRESCDVFGALEHEGAADSCKAAMQGWRQAFEAVQRPIPPACGAPR